MGLNFSHCNARWGYHGFDRFRSKLAKEMNLDYERLCNIIEKFDKYRKLDNLEDCNFYLNFLWGKDVLVHLLNHSDCDGYIDSDLCGPLAERLKKIIQKWPDDNENEYDKVNGLRLIKGLILASKNNERFVFCG